MINQSIKQQNILKFGDITGLVTQTISTYAWENLQSCFNKSKTIILVGHGGNLAIADHISVDITRLTNFEKSTICPGSAIAATSHINDSGFNNWMTRWLKSIIQTLDVKETLLIGISSSGRSKDISELFKEANLQNIKTALITAKPSKEINSDIQVVTYAESYHSSEIIALALGYQLVHGFGFNCPDIN